MHFLGNHFWNNSWRTTISILSAGGPYYSRQIRSMAAEILAPCVARLSTDMVRKFFVFTCTGTSMSVVRPFYLYNWNPYTRKSVFILKWNSDHCLPQGNNSTTCVRSRLRNNATTWLSPKQSKTQRVKLGDTGLTSINHINQWKLIS